MRINFNDNDFVICIKSSKNITAGQVYRVYRSNGLDVHVKSDDVGRINWGLKESFIQLDLLKLSNLEKLIYGI